mgnify:FL=1
MNKKLIKSKITIGLSVYNGDDTLERTIDSLLSQTYDNFQLILVDNMSTDETAKICSNYVKKDERVKYVRRKSKLHIAQSWAKLVENINTEYFMFAADDDIYESTFIEKNIAFLYKNSEFVASISDIKLFGEGIEKYFSDANKNFIDELQKKHRFVRTISGTFEEKVRNVLEFNWCMNTYSVFRTEQLQKGITNKTFTSWDFAFLLSMIKYGNFNVLDEKLLRRDTGGETSLKLTIIDAKKRAGDSGIGLYFPYVGFTVWCLQKFGLKLFLKHISYFKYLNVHTGKKMLRELVN